MVLKPHNHHSVTKHIPTVILGSLMIVIGFTYLTSGALETPTADVIRILIGSVWPGSIATDMDQRIAVVVLEVRLPRALCALLTGAALASAGACLQGLFRNPLADPGLIGVSSGGAVGAIAGISLLAWIPGFALAGFTVPGLAMAGAVATTFMVYSIARIAGRTHVTTLLLAGIAVNAFAAAIVGAVLYVSDNDALRRFTFWTLGSLHTATWQSFLWMALFIAPPLLVLPRFKRALNAFLLGEAEAYHLGFEVQRIKRWVIVLCALMVGVSVAFCGLIGFVGLVVPHWVRLMCGPDYRRLIPLSGLAGALLVLAADLIARTANAPAEIPIGIITALLGAPFFLFLIHRRKRDLGL